MLKVQRLLESRRTVLRAVVVAGFGLVLAGCPSDTDSTIGKSKEAAIYEAAITELSEQFQIVDPEPNRDPVLFIEAFDLEGIPLHVQVDMVAAFIDLYDVRFVDEREEAVRDSLPRRPVRWSGVLVGLAPIIEGETTTVRIELYEDDETVRAYRYTVAELTDGAWGVVGAPESVPPQGFVG